MTQPEKDDARYGARSCYLGNMQGHGSQLIRIEH